MNAKILIADDESDIVSMLGSFFESKGFRVLPAFNGAEALKQAEKQPDIILLDINMPGTDGLEVCKRIRDHISCPILFLTARIEDTDKVKGFAVGGDDYIVKPFSLVELEARVHPFQHSHRGHLLIQKCRCRSASAHLPSGWCCGFPDRSESGKYPPPSGIRWLCGHRCGRK